MPRLKWPSAAIAVLALAGCGGVAAIATGASSHTTVYATTPTSPGPINPAAVPLGDGYVSTTPKVGYVDSCVTHFGSIGGARTDGPWINATKHTWDYETKLTVNGRIHWPAGFVRGHDRRRPPGRSSSTISRRPIPPASSRSRAPTRHTNTTRTATTSPSRTSTGSCRCTRRRPKTPGCTPGRSDRRAEGRRRAVQRTRRRGSRRRRARGARHLRRPPRPVRHLPPPRRAGVHPEQGQERHHRRSSATRSTATASTWSRTRTAAAHEHRSSTPATAPRAR